MNRMHNPAHPGAVLREYLGEMSVTDAATALGITRTALSRTGVKLLQILTKS